MMTRCKINADFTDGEAPNGSEPHHGKQEGGHQCVS